MSDLNLLSEAQAAKKMLRETNNFSIADVVDRLLLKSKNQTREIAELREENKTLKSPPESDRPESIGQGHRIIYQQRKEIEKLKAQNSRLNAALQIYRGVSDE